MNNNIINYIKTLSDNEKIQKILIEILGKILSKQEIFSSFIDSNEGKIIHIRDWISSIIENNEKWKEPRVLTIDALYNAADKYFEKKINKLKTIELDENQEKLIANLGDYYIVQMLTIDALDNESKVMQHCIGYGGYDENLNNEEYKYLSLRDKKNKAHVTLEIKENKVLQLQGKQNRLPDEKYINKLVYWLLENKYEVDLKKFKLILNKNDNKIYSIFELPENCRIENDLSSYTIKKLPKNLTIDGYLYLRECRDLKELPKGLVVKKELQLQSSSITELPEDIKIGGDLYFYYSKIQKLPDDFTVNGNLYLISSKLEKVPKNLIVKEDLDLTGANIEELPEDIKVGKNLILEDCRYLEKIHKVNINGILHIRGCKRLKKLPENLSCHSIFIDEDQVNLISENMDFDKIVLHCFAGSVPLSKEQFFKSKSYRT